MRFTNDFVLFCLASLMAVALGGCVSQKASLADFDTKYCNGFYDESTKIALEKNKSLLGEKESSGSGDLLWILQAAASYRAASDYVSSCKLLDQCEAKLKKYDEESGLAGSSKTVAQVLLNDTVVDYRGQVYDGIMVNTYKALNFMAIGDMDSARIEFNRADDRQRRAVEYFEKEMRERQEEVEKNKNEDSQRGMLFDKAMSSPDLKASFEHKYPELDQWETYPDFVNPFTTYLHGLFFFLNSDDRSDMDKARDSFRRVLGMTPNQQAVEKDLILTEEILNNKTSKKTLPPTVWVVLENGLGPVKIEQRIDIPMFFEKVKYVGMALPKLKFRDSAYDSLLVNDSQKTLGQTQTLSSMDRVIQTEFKKDFTGIVTRAVLSTVWKSYAQYRAGAEYGHLGSLGVGLLQYATTQADVRMWTALPKDFQVARVPRPENGVLKLSDPMNGSEVFSVDLPPSQFVIVYVKAPAVGVAATGHAISIGPVLSAEGLSAKDGLSKSNMAL